MGNALREEAHSLGVSRMVCSLLDDSIIIMMTPPCEPEADNVQPVKVHLFTHTILHSMESAHQPIITGSKPAAAGTRHPRRTGSRPFADLIGRLQSEEASLPALQRSGFSRDDSYVRVPDGCKLAQRRPRDCRWAYYPAGQGLRH